MGAGWPRVRRAAGRWSVACVSAVGRHRLGTQDVPPLVRRGNPGVCDGPGVGLSAVAASLNTRCPEPGARHGMAGGTHHEPRQRRTPQRTGWSPRCVIWTWASSLLTRGLPGPRTPPRRLTVLHTRCTAWWRQVAVPPEPPTTDTLEAVRPIYAFKDLQDPADCWWSSCSTRGDSAFSVPPIGRGPTAWSSALSVTCRTRTGFAAYRARPSQVGGGRRH